MLRRAICLVGVASVCVLALASCKTTVSYTIGYLDTVVAMSAGASHTCTILSGGVRMYCWGSNSAGQLGNGSTSPANKPVAVSIPATVGGAFDALSAGFNHTCALLIVGDMYCWGDNTYGELGNGTSSSSATTPVQVVAS